MMLTRMHKRDCCLTYDYVTDDATDLLGKLDLDNISVLGSLVISRPAYSGVSHENALQEYLQRAKLWLQKSDQPIHPGALVIYAGLREKLDKIMASDYFTATPEMKAPVDVAAAVRKYSTTHQVQISEATTVASPAAQIEGSPAHYQQKEDEQDDFQLIAWSSFIAVAVSVTIKNLTTLIRTKSQASQTVSSKGTSSLKASAKATLDQALPFQRNAAIALLAGAFYLLSRYAIHCTWVTSEAYSLPSIILAARGAHGGRVIFDDYREAYFWLRQNTPPDAKVMSWWDFGYQITAMGKRTVMVDNNTWNMDMQPMILPMVLTIADPQDKDDFELSTLVPYQIWYRPSLDFITMGFGLIWTDWVQRLSLISSASQKPYSVLDRCARPASLCILNRVTALTVTCV